MIFFHAQTSIIETKSGIKGDKSLTFSWVAKRFIYSKT